MPTTDAARPRDLSGSSKPLARIDLIDPRNDYSLQSWLQRSWPEATVKPASSRTNHRM